MLCLAHAYVNPTHTLHKPYIPYMVFNKRNPQEVKTNGEDRKLPGLASLEMRWPRLDGRVEDG